mmetsp:Transcript_1458/g.2395  ORF Transcript_1458/g.2395 Transcript_1458/m.2395 type:complete len:234 (+) Transcript_1458:155-856(+)
MSPASGRKRTQGSDDHDRNSDNKSIPHGHKKGRFENTGISRGSDVWGKAEDETQPVGSNQDNEVVKEKANFGLTGALAKDESTGNIVNGVVLKWSEPLDAAKPDRQWRLYVFKEDKLVEMLHIHRQSSYLLGRDNRVADVVLAHPSCSKQHAVIQYRKVSVTASKRNLGGDDSENEDDIEQIIPYLMDLQSPHRTFLNDQPVDDARYYELRAKDVLKFGASTREYVLMHDTGK